MDVENWWEENYSTEDTKTSLQDSKKSDESVPVEDSVDSIPFYVNGTEYQIPKKWGRFFNVGIILFIVACYLAEYSQYN